MPLVNLPLIDYTLELLSASGIEYIIVICCDHVEQIKTHVTYVVIFHHPACTRIGSFSIFISYVHVCFSHFDDTTGS